MDKFQQTANDQVNLIFCRVQPLYRAGKRNPAYKLTHRLTQTKIIS